MLLYAIFLTACQHNEETIYISPEFYPFPRFNVSLETEKGTCNLGDRNQPDFCHAFSAGNTG
jgi:hypothetical protein